MFGIFHIHLIASQILATFYLYLRIQPGGYLATFYFAAGLDLATTNSNTNLNLL